MSLAQHLEGPARPATVRVGGPRGGPPLSTVLRRDNWRLQPVLVALGLLGFVAYVVWAANRNGAFYAGSVGRDYLSPLYSPCITHSCISSGYVWGGWSWWRVSPAWLILIFPGAFRATCYYYRKAYYRSFFWDPPACAVGEIRRRYRGETRLPLVLNNLHRFFWYPAVIVVVFLWIEAFETFDDHGHLYLGLGTLFLLLNAVLLSAYTFGCHAFRHLAGGGLDCYSCVRGGKSRFRLWRGVSVLNANHPMWAWVSMFSVVWAEVYVRLVQAGMPDPHLRF